MNYNMFDDIDYFTNFKGNNNDLNNNNNNNNLDLYSPYEGFIKGNLFKNLYQGYKNYEPYKIKVNTEQEEFMLNISEIGFMTHELNLYLDNFSNDKKALDLFNKYNKMKEELIKNYERRYGPLMVSGGTNTNIPFKWENDKWPWEV